MSEDYEISPNEVESYLVWEALAKYAKSQASKSKQDIMQKFAKHPDKLDAVNVADVEIRREYTSVDWDPAIIRTIENIDGVSDEDKAKLFKPPARPKANGVHLNSISKKYKGTVANRIADARRESGLTIKINPNRVIQQQILDKAQSLIKNTIEIEGEL
jgi:hypothetical protein